MENEEAMDLKIECGDNCPTKNPDFEDALASGEPVQSIVDSAEVVVDDDQHSCKELDTIHQDLTELVDKLNTFIAEQDDFYEFGSSFSGDDTSEHGSRKEEDDTSEKQDGPQEKELMKQKYQQILSPEDIYVCDGDNPPEVNWDTLAPFIQTIVGDLQRIRQLNQMTNSVMERIRCLTEANTEDNATGTSMEDK